MKKIALVIATVLMTVAAATAQSDKSGTDYENLRGPFLTNPFWDNWSISMGAGIDAWVRPSTVEGETYKGFNKVAPLFQLGATKMLAPNYGVRLQGNYGKIKDYTSLAGDYTKEQLSETKYLLDFNYWTVEADFLFNLSNAIGGYKFARFYNATLFTGFGFGRSSGADLDGDRSHNNQFLVNVGLLNTFRITEALDFYAELKTNVVSQQFAANNGFTIENDMPTYLASTKAGLIPSLTVGFTYKFNDRRFYKAQKFDATPYENRISDLEKQLAAAQTAVDNYKNKPTEIAEPVAQPVQAIVERVPLTVFFTIGKSDLSEAEMLHVRYAAEVIKSDLDKKVYILTGLADSGTGSAQRNQTLSEQRAEVVRKALIDLGVSADQLETKALGGTVDPFDIPEMNRVVIIER